MGGNSTPGTKIILFTAHTGPNQAWGPIALPPAPVTPAAPPAVAPSAAAAAPTPHVAPTAAPMAPTVTPALPVAHDLFSAVAGAPFALMSSARAAVAPHVTPSTPAAPVEKSSPAFDPSCVVAFHVSLCD